MVAARPWIEEPPPWEREETERLRAHFEWVLGLLHLQDVTDWGADRVQRRRRTLSDLEAYALRGRFPRNPLSHRMAPAFVDAAGTECAVAWLMLARGLDDVVERVRQVMNLAYVEEMGEDVDRFAATSGLSRAELALVQPDYCPPLPPCSSRVGSCDPFNEEECDCSTRGLPDGTPCSSGFDRCAEEACSNGSCEVVATVDCDDGDPMTYDACDRALGCVSAVIELPTPGEAEAPPEEGCQVSLGSVAGSPAPVLAALFLLLLRGRGRRAHSP